MTIAIAVTIVMAIVAVAWLVASQLRKPTGRRAAGLASMPEQDLVWTYVTAFLSTIAVETKSATLVESRPLPRLEALTRNPELVAWGSAFPTDYDQRLTSEAVIGFLIGFARWKTPEDREIATELQASIVGTDASPRQVTFRLHLTTAASGERHLDIHLQDP